MPETSTREPLNNVDAAWRHMEDATNLMMVTGVLVLESPVTIEAVRQTVEQALLKFDRFRQRVVDVGMLQAPHWEPVDQLDWDYHLQSVDLAGKDAHRELRDAVSTWMSIGLDFRFPLWQIHLLTPVEEGCAILLRIHHCIADGMALLRVLLSMTGNSARASLELGKTAQELAAGANASANASNVNRLEKARRATGKFIQNYIDTLIHPSRMIGIAKAGGEGASTAARLIFRGKDPQTPFKGELGVPKRAAWSRPIDLDEIKKIKNVTGSTVNDVLLAAMSGALRRYLLTRDFDVEGVDVHAAVPVNLRPNQGELKLGNEFGLVFLRLPLGIEDALDRIFEVRARMRALKNSSEAIVSFAMLQAVGMTPVEIQRLIVGTFGAKTTAVMTNVPGPSSHLYIAGSKVRSLMFWVPQSGRVGLGVSILSYSGEVRLGLATDVGLVPDPEIIIDNFHVELSAMAELYRQVEGE